MGDIYELEILLFALLEIKNHSRKKQTCVLARVLNYYRINVDKLE